MPNMKKFAYLYYYQCVIRIFHDFAMAKCPLKVHDNRTNGVRK